MNQHHLSAAKSVFFPSALTASGWQENVVMGISPDGKIASLESNQSPKRVDEFFDVVALPGMVNVHSHAFQRALAGLTEYRTARHDSFWTWRKLMYDFLEQLTPDDMYTIARQLYLEMLLAGYTWVGEFHYLHNDFGGRRYGNLAEMSESLIRAAQDTGIGLCLLPTLYQRGGFDDAELAGGQQRFELSNSEFLQLYEYLSEKQSVGFSVNLAIHSLRAVSFDAANEIISSVRSLNPDCCVHIHIAEQVKEVEDCHARHGLRPVEFLFENFAVNGNWCLIHATHSEAHELELIANSCAVVGLCPSTEANLGDGFFSARDFFDTGGLFAIGGDSHCSVDLRDELRTMEYVQRLRTRQRAILGTDVQSTGRHLYQRAAFGGGQALGVEAGVIKIGARADLTLVDPNHPAIAGATGDRLIDRLIFCNADDPIIGSIVGGQMYSMDQPEFQQQVIESQDEFVELSRRLMGNRS